MKTVQDYRNLGLVLADGDKLSSAVEDGWVYKKSESHLPLKYHGVVSFEWRNNDGVKPEYKGMIEVRLNNAIEISGTRADREAWSHGYLNSVVKWRPVVSMCNHTELKPRHSFATAISIDGPKFWNKSIKTINYPCVAVNVEAINQAVSPREDKPMKPVYTAEMHAKRELPQVDVKVKVCIKSAGFDIDEQDEKFEGKTVTVKAVFSNVESEKIVAVENEDGNCACYIIECIKPIIKTIKVNGFDVPAPMSEAPMVNDEYFTPQTGYEIFYCKNKWRGDKFDSRFLSRGLIHSNESAAIAHAKAMLGIDPNA